MLRWLLIFAVLAGAGVLQGGDCLPHTGWDTAPLAYSMTTVATPAVHLGTTESNGHTHRLHPDSSLAQRTQTTADDCHLQPAPSTAATITSSTPASPATAIRTSPVEAPVPVRRPRLPVAVTLTEIGISRI
jgi:hypothetical protein